MFKERLNESIITLMNPRYLRISLSKSSIMNSISIPLKKRCDLISSAPLTPKLISFFVMSLLKISSAYLFIFASGLNKPKNILYR